MTSGAEPRPVVGHINATPSSGASSRVTSISGHMSMRRWSTEKTISYGPATRSLSLPGKRVRTKCNVSHTKIA